MSFFHQLHNISETVDITLHIVRKGENLTLEVTPHAKTAARHVVMTGTPAELSDGFLQAIILNEVAPSGLKVQDLPDPTGDGSKTESKEKPQSKPQKTPKPKPVKPAKPEAAEKPARGKAVKESPKTKELSMFDQPQEEEEKSIEEDAPGTKEELATDDPTAEESAD